MKTSSNVQSVALRDHQLRLRVHCTSGYQAALLRLCPGVFDASTLDIEMDEFPSGKTVWSRGWDLHQFEPRMAVPVFTAFQDGRELGDVWFDGPNYQEHARGVLDAEFGFHVETGGDVELCLEIIPADRARLRWNMLESLEVAPDDRAAIPLKPRGKKRAPYLFLNGRAVGDLRAAFAAQPAFAAPLQNIAEILEEWDGVPREKQAGKSATKGRAKKTPPPYVPIEQIVAAAALMTDAPEWIDRARACLRRLCSQPTWSQQPNPRLMLGDNDMAVGHPLLSVSMICHFIEAHLSPAEREMALAKVREYGRKLYEFSVLQKRWATGMGHITSHETCPLLALAVASMTFWDEVPEAQLWLAWAHGRMRVGLEDVAQDGRHAWPTYGPNFFVSYAAALRDFAGVDWWQEPFLKKLPFAVLHGQAPASLENNTAAHRDLNAFWILAACATYGDSVGAAAAWRQFWRTADVASSASFIGWQDMLWQPSQAGRSTSPVTAALNGSHLFEDTGYAVLRAGELSCVFQCGVGVGRAGWQRRKRYGMELHDARCDGGLEVTVNGVPVIAPAPSSYRRGFSTQSVVAVDGSGHYMDGRVLGVRPHESWLSRIVRYNDSRAQTVVEGDNSGAYREELGVTRSRRRVQLNKRMREITVEDEIQLQQPRRVAARFQCTGRIKKIAPGHYRLTAADRRTQLDLWVEDAARFRIRIRPAQMVLHYIYGMNVKKGRKTQGLGLEPPRPWFLEIAAPGKVARVALRVTMRPCNETDEMK
jgi:hypothetical protein